MLRGRMLREEMLEATTTRALSFLKSKMLVHDFQKCLATRDDQLARMDKRNLRQVVTGCAPQKLMDVSVSEERTEVVSGVRSLD